ncbi:hypothetical protein RND71_035140 [Anisodus tanguticus]|uniref:Uncharacterized protein n=1 Tax=Anisodus tanguticus TaxID=243964 RepID=A0AAE1V1A3_9SOLA|nr:hypothetical protein RND71_035140 [Anisodus tanguticus]
MAEGIILNSFKDLAPGAIKALQEEEFGDSKPKVYPVGPLIRMDTMVGSSYMSNLLNKQ